MYTVLWEDCLGCQYWERIPNMKEVRKYIRENNLVNDNEVIIFSPAADTYGYNQKELFQKHILEIK